jgi:hypothetical protein
MDLAVYRHTHEATWPALPEGSRPEEPGRPGSDRARARAKRERAKRVEKSRPAGSTPRLVSDISPFLMHT